MENDNWQFDENENTVKDVTRKKRFIVIGILVVMILLVFLFFKSVSYVGNRNFCGACHTMAPYNISWQQSSHSETSCFQCHFGTLKKTKVEPIPVTPKQYWNFRIGSKSFNISPQMNKVKEYVVRINKRIDDVRVQWTYSIDAIKYYRQLADMMMGGRSNGAEITWNNCASCHANIVSKDSKLDSTGHSRHLTAGLTCQKCHGDVAHENIVKIEREDCLKCHADGLPKPKSHRTSLFNSEHGKLYVKRDSCRICHTKGGQEKLCMDCHGITIPHPKGFASVHVETIKKTDIKKCANCHGEDPNQTKTTGNKNAQSSKRNKTTAAARKLSTKPCAVCHGNGFPHQGRTGMSVVNIHTKQIKELGIARCYTCHNKNQCTDCHGFEMPHPKGFISNHVKSYRTDKAADCVRCHIDGKGSAPKCYVCHGVDMPHTTKFKVSHGEQDQSKCKLCHSQSNPVNSRSRIASPTFCINCHKTPRHYDGHWNKNVEECVRCHFDYQTCSLGCH